MAYFCCADLTEIDILVSVISIDSAPLWGCVQLMHIGVLPDNPSPLSVVDGPLLAEGDSTLVCVPAASQTEQFGLPRDVVRIDREAFDNCAPLMSVTLPDGLIEICDGAFTNCSGLKRIVIPDGVTKIDGRAFMNCVSLTFVALTGSLTAIDTTVFNNCLSLAARAILDNVTEIGDKAFHNCESLTLIVGPDSYARQYCEENGLVDLSAQD